MSTQKTRRIHSMETSTKQNKWWPIVVRYHGVGRYRDAEAGVVGCIQWAFIDDKTHKYFISTQKFSILTKRAWIYSAPNANQGKPIIARLRISRRHSRRPQNFAWLKLKRFGHASFHTDTRVQIVNLSRSSLSHSLISPWFLASTRSDERNSLNTSLKIYCCTSLSFLGNVSARTNQHKDKRSRSLLLLFAAHMFSEGRDNQAFDKWCPHLQYTRSDGAKGRMSGTRMKLHTQSHSNISELFWV